MKSWSHKVEKMMKGSDGKWFSFGCAGTFQSEAEATEYAKTFAEEQRAAGITTARFVVRSRKSVDGSNFVSEIRI